MYMRAENLAKSVGILHSVIHSAISLVVLSRLDSAMHQ